MVQWILSFALFVAVIASGDNGEIEPPLTPRDIVLSSPQITNFGDWFAWEYCPKGSFINGMKLKTESYKGTVKDDSALNGVQLYCGEIGSKTINGSITSGMHKFGEFGKDFFCDGGIATGFQLRSEKYQTILADDTAANNLRLYCNNHRSSFIEGDGLHFGDWTKPQECFSKQGLCGVQTQVEVKDGNGDETSLNNINFRCCDIPDPATICKPEDTWDMLIDCDNIEAVTPTTCSYQRKVGISHTRTDSESHEDTSAIYHDLGFSLKGAPAGLSINFEYNLAYSHVTGHNWTRSTTEVWNEETTTTISFDVPPKIRTTLLQTIGKCGIYKIRATRVKRIDTEQGSLSSKVTYIDI